MNEVERHSVTGYGRQDINYNDPEGEFVYYEDYAALKDSAMDYAYRWGKAQDDIKKAHMLHSMQKEEIASLKEQLTNAQEALKSAGIEADTVQAGVVELVSRMHRLSGDREKFAVQCAAAKIAVQYARAEGFECSLNTPDVDAYLNAVRAEGLKMAIDHMNRQTSENCADVTVLPIIEMYERLRSGNAGKDGSHE